MSEENLAEKIEQQIGAVINREIVNNMFAEMFNGTECSKPEYDNKLKVRFHRGGLKDSMETCFEPKDWNDFVSHCVEEDKDIIIDSIKCELYDDEPDTRIDWDKTWIITARFPYDKKHDYPIGFSDRNIMELKR